MAQVDSFRVDIVADLLKRYKANDVWNFDETGIYYQLEPNKTISKE